METTKQEAEAQELLEQTRSAATKDIEFSWLEHTCYSCHGTRQDEVFAAKYAINTPKLSGCQFCDGTGLVFFRADHAWEWAMRNHGVKSPRDLLKSLGERGVI